MVYCSGIHAADEYLQNEELWRTVNFLGREGESRLTYRLSGYCHDALRVCVPDPVFG